MEYDAYRFLSIGQRVGFDQRDAAPTGVFVPLRENTTFEGRYLKQVCG